MQVDSSYHAGCFCGQVGFVVTGKPMAMGFCHCNSCRHWSAAPASRYRNEAGNTRMSRLLVNAVLRTAQRL